MFYLQVEIYALKMRNSRPLVANEREWKKNMLLKKSIANAEQLTPRCKRGVVENYFNLLPPIYALQMLNSPPLVANEGEWRFISPVRHQTSR
jgi:hypothetical protein